MSGQSEPRAIAAALDRLTDAAVSLHRAQFGSEAGDTFHARQEYTAARAECAALMTKPRRQRNAGSYDPTLGGASPEDQERANGPRRA